ncbi:hypothetical protein GCM10011452_17370 [Gemmobacter lanyuensis]|uniref:Uncharacterized protein n=1 Tax=Gemmobacter lanyuensis TaxID=1054497 RepID=A0A918IRZ2_9RHOB|nr:hypothetical protein GCM10011452_17370 [Gemmobacter lanyuensis]
MIKGVTLFLIVMVVMAIFFRHRVTDRLVGPGRCPKCGRHRIGKAPCPCGGTGRKDKA